MSEDGTIRVWDVTTGEQLYEFDAPGESARCCAYRPCPTNAHGLPSGQRALACGFTNGLSRVFDVGATSLLAEHRQHKGAVVAIAFTPDGGRMITAGSEVRGRGGEAMGSTFCDHLRVERNVLASSSGFVSPPS